MRLESNETLLRDGISALKVPSLTPFICFGLIGIPRSVNLLAINTSLLCGRAVNICIFDNKLGSFLPFLASCLPNGVSSAFCKA